MSPSRTIFSQVVAHFPKKQFRRLVERYSGDKHVRTFGCWEQFLCMVFAQITFRESLRDIEACLNAFGPKLYHAGIRGKVSRSTLARANELRDWRIYQDFAQHLIKIARKLYANEDFGIELKNTVYAFDSTTIDLSLTLFPWAHFMNHPLKKKSAVKLHTLLDLRGNIPTFISISDGKMGDTLALDELVIEHAAFYVLDRGYFDFNRLARFQTAGAYFITRSRAKMLHWRVASAPVDTNSNVLSDKTIRLSGQDTRHFYPWYLRRIRFYDEQERRVLVFLTNNFELPARTIADLYKCRWQIELFFKWLKQNLRIKAFFGYSANALRTQIWISVATYVLIAIIKKRLALSQSLSTILQVFSLSLFEKMPIYQAFSRIELQSEGIVRSNQLNSFTD
jgi:hypothetical protein